MVEAIQLYAVEHHRLPHTLKERIEQEQMRLMGQLAGGSAADWPDYKERVGVIRGLIVAAELCDKIEQELSKG